ncbi:unnamed protein product [Larinioides sclopetarius]|uniref:Uncharacterized protein n=1 Tax=Larinioides sclopetarius TaxID=280406 RepID=A0AAV2BTJ8_9ARAC
MLSSEIETSPQPSHRSCKRPWKVSIGKRVESVHHVRHFLVEVKKIFLRQKKTREKESPTVLLLNLSTTLMVPNVMKSYDGLTWNTSRL